MMDEFSITIDSSELAATENLPYDLPTISYPTVSYGLGVSSSFSTPNVAPRSQTSTVDAAQERLFTDLSSLYSANEQLKTNPNLKSTSKDKHGSSADNVGEKLDDLLESFMSGANAVLDELSFLGNAHPALAIAIFAFHEVVKFDIARRDNNKKVLVMVVQMQGMMGPMFQLRNLNRDHMTESEREFYEGRLKELADVITRNIKECRSDISHFMNRKFMLKMVLAKGYEKKFATHMKTFAVRRSELQSVISEYLAIGISSANATLTEVGRKLDVVDGNLEIIISKLFRNLDTPRERDVFNFMEQNGGPHKCVDDLDLLPKLITKVGESPSAAGNSAIYDQEGLRVLQKQLTDALAEDLEKVLEKHYSRFEKILQVQNNNLKSMSVHLEDQGVLMQTHATKLGKILDTVTTIMVMEEGKIQTKAVKLKDPEIHRVWTRMNLTTSSVKAKVFVLTFRDHIHSDNSTMGSPILTGAALPGQEADPTMLAPFPAATADKEADAWVLDYIDVSHVRPIVEAMDEDGSGFISVKEANSFALARPLGLSLLHWIAYWAAGWHLNLANQKKEIYSVLLDMHAALPDVHVANRKLVDDYLDDRSLRRVEALLRSIQPLSDNGRKELKLLEVANTVASSQFERLKTNLDDMGFSIESGADATTIGGSARIEAWILPLLLLLLRRHLNIIYLSKTVILDKNEFNTHVTSLSSVFIVFYERMESLEARFRQLHRDIDAQFENFAYGMFLTAFKKRELNTSENTLLTLKLDEYNSPRSERSASDEPVDSSILSKPVGSPFQYEKLDFLPSEPVPDDHVPHPLEGLWTGLMTHYDNGLKDFFLCVVHPFTGKVFTGKGESYYAVFGITNGEFDTEDTSSDGLIGVTFDTPGLFKVTYQGRYDPQKDVINGTFSWIADEVQEVQPENTYTKSPDSTGPDVKDNQNLDETNPLANQAGEPEPDSTHAVKRGDTADLEGETKQVLNHDLNSNKALDNPASMLEEEKPVTRGNFYLRRTPPDVFRFRYLLDGPGSAPCWAIWPTARKRWAFAIEAILFQTRVRMGSRKAFSAILAERRRWLVHAQRYELGGPEYSYRYEMISDAEWEDYKTMMSTVNPTIARLYETTSLYFLSRGKWAIGFFYCDACKKSLAFTRYQCIVCMEDDLSHTIDLCENCFNKPGVVHGAGNLTHIRSHSLLRSRHRVHSLEVKTLIAESRLISERSKNIFRTQEAKKLEIKGRDSRKVTKGKGTKNWELASTSTTSDAVVQTCACCSEAVATPCWVCVSCSPLTFICDRCDRKGATVVQPGRNHLLEHHLLRIHDSVEVKPIKTNDTERQLEEINLNISALEKKVDIQLEAAEKMKSVVTGVARTVGVPEDDHSSLGSEDGSDSEDNTELNAQASAEAEVNGTAPRPNGHQEKSESHFVARISALETKIENVNQHNQALDDRYATLGTKIDALQAKMDCQDAKMDRQFESLLTLLQQILPPPLPIQP